MAVFVLAPNIIVEIVRIRKNIWTIYRTAQFLNLWRNSANSLLDLQIWIQLDILGLSKYSLKKNERDQTSIFFLHTKNMFVHAYSYY